MSDEIVKVIVESGYFWLARKQQWYPHRRALWANRLFVRGPVGTNWQEELLKFRNFIRYSQNYFSQINKMTFWKASLPLANVRENQIAWGSSITLWDNARVEWPRNPINNTEPHISWACSYYRGTAAGNAPLPPSVSYRYERMAGLENRKQYGYLRCVESRYMGYGSYIGSERLPFHVNPVWLASLHASQITEPLTRSGMNAWHASGNPIREVVISHREGITSVLDVNGYLQGIVTTTARNFSLPVL